MGTSGQNVDDIYKYAIEEDNEARLRCACRTLDWGHVAPTAPDTLGEHALIFNHTVLPDWMTDVCIFSVEACYPLADRDPFLIEDCPDIYFVGNQPMFGSKIYQGESLDPCFSDNC